MSDRIIYSMCKWTGYLFLATVVGLLLLVTCLYAPLSDPSAPLDQNQLSDVQRWVSDDSYIGVYVGTTIQGSGRYTQRDYYALRRLYYRSLYYDIQVKLLAPVVKYLPSL